VFSTMKLPVSLCPAGNPNGYSRKYSNTYYKVVGNSDIAYIPLYILSETYVMLIRGHQENCCVNLFQKWTSGLDVVKMLLFSNLSFGHHFITQSSLSLSERWTNKKMTEKEKENKHWPGWGLNCRLRFPLAGLILILGFLF
jgi:hypothetical protein